MICKYEHKLSAIGSENWEDIVLPLYEILSQWLAGQNRNEGTGNIGKLNALIY